MLNDLASGELAPSMGRYTVPGELSGAAIPIDVVYAGPDLGHVAEITGLSIEAVIAAHTSGPWRVEYCGFAPGFAYLTGGNPRLVVPRLNTPRPEVPCGAVGLAGEYSGIYPRPSPGGWNLIGRTNAVLWDLDRDPPALLRTGMRVLFRAVREHVDAGGTMHGARAGAVSDSTAQGVDGDAGMTDAPRPGPSITVVSPGMLCLVEDLGRPGYEDMGVSPSGAADRGAAIRANRLVGNPDDAAVLEILLGGAILRADETATLAVTGAAVSLSVELARESGSAATSSEERVEAEPAPVKSARQELFTEPMDRPFALPTGATLRLGRPKQGLRTYLSVRGGVDVLPVLGSRSTDTLSGLGPPPVAAGTRLPIGPAPAAEPETRSGSDSVPTGAVDAGGAVRGGAATLTPADRGEEGNGPAEPAGIGPAPAGGSAGDGARTVIPDSGRGAAEPATGESRDGATCLDATPGPQHHWFGAAVHAQLQEQMWTVSPRSNRVGVRLHGAALQRTVETEMRIQPLTRGAIQVPPSGEPIVFLADVPVTGGYPVIAVLTGESVDRLAQARPGGSVRIRLR